MKRRERTIEMLSIREGSKVKEIVKEPIYYGERKGRNESSLKRE